MVKNLLRQAFETIQFQNGSFARELEFMISNFREQPYNKYKAQKSKEVKAIESFILNKTGLNIKLLVNEPGYAAVFLPLLTINHIFFHDITAYMEDEAKHEIKKNTKKFNETESIIIDLKNSKVSGALSDIEVPLILEWDTLLTNKDMTDAEVTAILLHELGHLFTTYEYVNRLYTTNLAILSIAQSMVDGEKDTYVLELKKQSKKLFGDENALNSIIDVKDKKVITSFVLTTELKRVNSELGTPYYDSVSCEYLADQFASRHGYGKHLITALDKLYGFFAVEKNIGTRIITDLITIYAMVLTPVGAITALLSGNILLVFVMVFLGFILYHSSKVTNHTPIYDELKIRFTRAREQMIQQLKQMSKENDSVLVENIKALDETKAIIDKIKVYTPIHRKLMTFLSPTQRKAQDALNLQRELEELASNELYVQSAKLNTIKI